jgi:hypothetical protein
LYVHIMVIGYTRLKKKLIFLVRLVSVLDEWRVEPQPCKRATPVYRYT